MKKIQAKLKNAKGIQKGEATTVAKINTGIIPFNPAVNIESMDKRLAIEVKIQATNKAERLNPPEIPASFHDSYFLGLMFNL